MKPRHYQVSAIDEILTCFETYDETMYCLATGGGKTALFSFLAQKFVGDSNKRVAILGHRTELISQTINTLFNIGMRSEAVVANKKYLMHSSQVYVAMVETIYKRLQKNEFFLPPLDLLIIDEAHIMTFVKVKEILKRLNPGLKILAVTATPTTTIVEKTYRDIGRGEVMEYKQTFGLHYYYKRLIVGYAIQNLIEDGNLVPELVFDNQQIKRNELVIDEKTNEFKPVDNRTEKMCAVVNYEKFCKGKKTIIFTASTKDNISILNDFKEKGYENARIFDSVNKEESGDRAELLKWYKKTPDAILINTGVFTTGFDEPTIQAVMLAMSTASISKYFQMIGRGGRATNLIFKDLFIVVDLGGNVEAFGKWSAEVDWAEYFYYTSKLVPKKEALEKITFCENCDEIISATAQTCPHCGHEKPKRVVELTEKTVHVGELIYPSGEKIVKYCDLHSKDKRFAVDILLKQAVDLFIYTEVDLQHIEATIKHGKFFKTMSKILDEQILIIQSSGLAGEYKNNHITELIDLLFKTLK